MTTKNTNPTVSAFALTSALALDTLARLGQTSYVEAEPLLMGACQELSRSVDGGGICGLIRRWSPRLAVLAQAEACLAWRCMGNAGKLTPSTSSDLWPMSLALSQLVPEICNGPVFLTFFKRCFCSDRMYPGAFDWGGLFRNGRPPNAP